jgi:hypothetical protein
MDGCRHYHHYAEDGLPWLSTFLSNQQLNFFSLFYVLLLDACAVSFFFLGQKRNLRCLGSSLCFFHTSVEKYVPIKTMEYGVVSQPEHDVSRLLFLWYSF